MVKNPWLQYSRKGGIRFFRVFHLNISVSVSKKRKAKLRQNLIYELLSLHDWLYWKWTRFFHVLECSECQQVYVGILKSKWRRLICR